MDGKRLVRLTLLALALVLMATGCGPQAVAPETASETRLVVNTPTTVRVSATSTSSPTVEAPATSTPSSTATLSPTLRATELPKRMTLASPAFAEGDMIPERYSCKGEDISPALRWQDVPSDAVSLALICEDPDAPMGTWVHWVLYNIPAGTTGLDEGVVDDPTLPDGSRHGHNSWRRPGYGGPCPPSGTHRYYFRLYALDTTLDLPPDAGAQDLREAMQGHILAEAELMGKFTH